MQEGPRNPDLLLGQAGNNPEGCEQKIILSYHHSPGTGTMLSTSLALFH